MSGPYFQKHSWPAFTYQETTYKFTHLDEIQIAVTDSAGVTRLMAVSFSDHCFTRDPRVGDDPALRYPASSRNPGYFCTERYQQSLQIVARLTQALGKSVWLLGHDNYAIVTIVDHLGNPHKYGIIFSLDRVTGLPVKLHMRVRSAHVRDENDLTTFGTIKFAHLVKLRMQGTQPNRIMSGRRKKP